MPWFKRQGRRYGAHLSNFLIVSILLAGLMEMTMIVLPVSADTQLIGRVLSPLQLGTNQTASLGKPLWLEWDAHSRLASCSKLLLTGFPISLRDTVDLDLERFNISTPDVRIVAATDKGDIPLGMPEMSLFRGVVAGRSPSQVILGVSPRGMQGIIKLPEDEYVFSPSAGKNGERNHVHELYKISDYGLQLTTGKLECGVQNRPGNLPSFVWEGAVGPMNAGLFYVCRFAVECDYEFSTRFNDYGAALDYIYILFGAIGLIFERDVYTKLTLTYIRIWTTVNDPYSAHEALGEFSDYWRAHHNPGQPEFVERDLAHMLSNRGVQARANYAGLCNYNDGFSVSGGIAGETDLVLRLVHDVNYAGHEIGHNFDGHHTHCLIDPATGTWVDRCATDPGCNQTQDCSKVSSSIMSYCDSGCGVPAAILTEFDSVNISLMRSHILSSCLPLARDPCYVDWRNVSGTENGTLAHPYNTISEAARMVLPQGTVSIAEGNYAESITIWQSMLLTSTSGLVVVGR